MVTTEAPYRTAAQLSFEGMEVQTCQGSLAASVVILAEPLKIGDLLEVTILSEVTGVRFEGNPPKRLHVLKPLEARKVEPKAAAEDPEG